VPSIYPARQRKKQYETYMDHTLPDHKFCSITAFGTIDDLAVRVTRFVVSKEITIRRPSSVQTVAIAAGFVDTVRQKGVELSKCEQSRV
jgi:hypothetical protein